MSHLVHRAWHVLTSADPAEPPADEAGNFEDFRTWVEHAQKRLRRIHGMQQKPVQGSEVIGHALWTVLSGSIAKERTKCVPAHADVEPTKRRSQEGVTRE